MERFLISCDQAASYPKNLIHYDAQQHNLNAYVETLNTVQLDLFSDEKNGKLMLMEYNVQTRQSQSSVISSLQDLKTHLRSALAVSEPKPSGAWTFVFLTAPNSRDRLYTSRKLLTYVLSYHQAMSSFLDFLFPFGNRESPRDMNFSGFRQDSRLEPFYSRLELPELGRSGRELRMCYNLKSVEPTKSKTGMPWTVRQIAVNHSLDVVTGNAFWVIVKGNTLIKERIEAATDPSKANLDDLGFQGNPFATSLATHMIICDWCSETWRLYLSCLEEILREKTAYFFAVNMQQPVHVARSLEGNQSRTPDLLSPSNVTSTSSAFPNQTQFSFSHFLEIQTIEDRAREVCLMLESNINVLTQLQEHYSVVILSENCPQDLTSGCQLQIDRFVQRINSIINNLRAQQLRTTNLLRLVADRKNLLHTILQFQNTESSNALALRTQESSQNMELMTKDMHILALKTKSETVSMRIITLVTLFFLPGTFISTIMSTDIVKFQTDSTGRTLRMFYPGALLLFLSICLPLMVAVFIAWYGVYWWIDRKETKQRQRQLRMDMVKLV